MTELQFGSTLEKPVSWERIFTETKACIKKIENYNKYSAIVALFSSFGALLFQPHKDLNKQYRFFYYEGEIGALSSEKVVIPRKKGVFGTTTVIQAVITAALANDNFFNESLERGIEAGLMMARLLLAQGCSLKIEKQYKHTPFLNPCQIKFPVKSIAKHTKLVFEMQKILSSDSDFRGNKFMPDLENELKKKLRNDQTLFKKIIGVPFRWLKTREQKSVYEKSFDKKIEYCGKFPSSILIDDKVDFSKPNTSRPVNSILKHILTFKDVKDDHRKYNDIICDRKGNISTLNDVTKDDLLFQFCMQIVERGAIFPLLYEGYKVVPPFLRFGTFLTYDKNQIEQTCETYNVLKSYMRDQSKRTPLSICVFGPAGAGKSEAVKQIAQHINENKKETQDETETLTFNISQFDDHKQLFEAFHQIRDVGIGDKLPVVFFDEFDTGYGANQGGELGWLRFFLAPMQDGEFYENGQKHIIGRAIFVFAGSTFKKMNEFIKYASDNEKTAKSVKLPDFISRIKGYLDVSGQNKAKDTGPHILHYIRRASLLRSNLERRFKIKKKHYIGITDLALELLLNVKEYKHGARSMDAIVSEFDGVKTISAETLCNNPSRLRLHLDEDDVEEFENIVLK